MPDANPIVAALDLAGYRLTEPRRAVADLIAEQTGHFTASDLEGLVRDRRLGISRATLFRALELLTELGVVERLDLPSGEHAYVPCARAHHHHVVCSRCGRTAEAEDCGVSEAVAEIARRTGFRIDSPPARAVRALPALPDPNHPRRLTPCPMKDGRIIVWAALRLSRRVAVLVAAIGLTAGLAACQGPGSSAASPGSGGLKVVTTTTVFADIVRNIGGERVAVSSIIPAGVGPEDYEPKPDDAKLLSDAQLIVSNGVGLDDFLDDLLASGSGGSTPRLVLGEGIPTVTEDGEENPHFWLDPSLVKEHYVPNIAAKLAEIDPAGKAGFEARGRHLQRGARYARQRAEGEGRTSPRREPQARHVPRRVSVLRPPLRL